MCFHSHSRWSLHGTHTGLKSLLLFATVCSTIFPNLRGSLVWGTCNSDFFSAAFSDYFIPGLSWVPLPKNLHMCKVMAPFQTQVKLGSEGQIAVQGSRQTSIPETSRPGWEQRHNMTWPGTYNTQRPWVCDLMIWADNSCWSSERCLGPEHSYSEPILAPGFGNVKREVEKLALLLLLLLDNSRVRLFSCSKLPGHDCY